MKKLKEQEASLIKGIINQDGSVIEMDNKRYYLSLIEEPELSMDKKATCPEVEKKIKNAKQDILTGDCKIDDVVDMMDRGVL